MMRSITLKAAVLAAIAGLASACSLLPGKHPIDSDKLDTAVSNRLGGASTCVILRDAKSGGVVYQYGADDVCIAPLPPCATFDVPAALVGLDAGVITPQTVYKWDGSPQPVGAWQTDANITKAYHDDIQWWWQTLTQTIGRDRMTDALKRLDYGNHNADGPERSFWQGPQNGGSLGISTRQQAAFFQKFYAGSLGAKPQTTGFIESLLVDEVRDDSKLGKATISSAPGSCAIRADGSRAVGWSVGRLQAEDRDLIFAVSVAGENAPPGIEVQLKFKDALADAGLWPAG